MAVRSDGGLARTATSSAHSDDRGVLADTAGRLVEFFIHFIAETERSVYGGIVRL